MTLAHQNGEVNLANKNRLFGGWFGFTELKQKLFRGWFNVTQRRATKYITLTVPLREFSVETPDRLLTCVVGQREFSTNIAEREFTINVPLRTFKMEV